MEIINSVEQGSEEWLAMRLGIITASKFKDVMAGGAGKTRKSYMYQLAAEIVTGEIADSFSNSFMEWGNENEPAARAMYELENECTVDQVSFIKLDEMVGCSPDGLVGDDGLVEFKCPKTTTQIETFLSGKMPTMHKAQVQGQMFVSNRQWCDFVSFDPRIDGDASWFQVRIKRDEEYIKTLSEALQKFSSELTEIVNKLRCRQ